MLKNMVRGECKTIVEYKLVFYYDNTGGFAFPCDENGKVLPLNPAAIENLAWCRQHPEKFSRNGEVVRHKRSWREPDTGVCECGERIELFSQYRGACECPNCGRWYNLLGQELLPPDQWPEDDDEY